MSISECRIISFPKIADARGNLSFIEGNRQIPFSISRVYYTYDVPGGSVRGGHAHRELQQVIISISGSFDVYLDDGSSRVTYHLNRSYLGLYVPKMCWRELGNFSSGAVCLVLASNFFDELDYYRDYSSFLAAVEGSS